MSEKRKRTRVEDSACKFCSKPVGGGRGFVKVNEPSPQVACVHHPGVLDLWPRDLTGSTLFVKRGDPTTRDGRFLTVELDPWHKDRGLRPGSPEARRALNSLIRQVAGLDARAGGQASENPSRPSQTDYSSSPSLAREKGKGGVGGGWGSGRASECAPDDHRNRDPWNNLFRDLRESELDSKRKKSRGQNNRKGKAAVEAVQ